jgi:ribonuclease Z
MFELVFLGTAAAVPSAERGLPAVVVARGPDRFLVDCGEGTQRQLMRAGIGFRGLGRVLLTHAHLDHIGGLAGIIATRALFGLTEPLEIIGSRQTIELVAGYLAQTVGTPEASGYRLRPISAGPVLALPGWRIEAAPVAHRRSESLGYVFCEEARRPLLAERLGELGIPPGPDRRALAAGRSVTLADGRHIRPEAVRGPALAGAKLVVIGDVEEIVSLIEPARGADALVIEATFLERDAGLARARGHLTAASAALLAREAGVGRLLLTHISGRYRPQEILAEAAATFPATQIVNDLDRVEIRPRRGI